MELASAVKEYKNGNKEAFQDIYEESNRYIYACINKVLSGNDNAQDMISDVMQDTYMEISQSIGQLDNCDKFLSWAGMIATRKCYAIVSKNKKYVLSNEEESFDDIPDDTSLIPEEVMEDKVKQKIIRDIIDKELTPMQKLCIVAYYYNEQKQGDIARELNIPENTVKTNLSRAKQKIKEAVLDIEKKDGTKLYSIAPFMLLLFKDEIGNAVVPGAVSNSILGAGAVTKGTSAVLTTGAKVATMTLKAKIIAASIAVGVVALVGGGVAIASIIAQEPEQIEEEAHKDKKDKKNKDIVDADVDDAWKNQYIDIVQDWQTSYMLDDCLGYNLVYIDDDDIPELCLVRTIDGWPAIDAYTITDDGAHRFINDMPSLGLDGHNLKYYEKSGYFIATTYMIGDTYYFYPLNDDIFFKSIDIYSSKEKASLVVEDDFEGHTNVEYNDQNGNRQYLSYEDDYEINDMPDVDSIKDAMHIDSFGYPYELNVLDTIMTYDEICVILGITDKVSMPDYSYLINHAEHLLTYYYDGVYQNTDLDGSPMYGPEFALADLNYDGYLDLVVSGYTGYTSIQNSEISIWDGNKLSTQLTADCPYAYNRDYIWFDGAGDFYYTDESRAFDSWELGYTFDANGNLVEKYSSYYSEEIEMSDFWLSRGVLQETYKIDGLEVSKDEYEKSSSKGKELSLGIEYVSLDLESVVEYFKKYGIDLSVLDQTITGDEYVVTSDLFYKYNTDYGYFENPWGTYYTYDDNWNLSNEVGFSGGTETYNIYWNYDNNGNLISTNESEIRQTEECDDTYVVRDYDDKDREISYISYFDDGSICSWYTYEYNDMNMLTTSTSYNEDGSVFEITKFEYDDDLMETNRIIYDANGQVKRTIPREYDKFERQTRFGNEYYEYDVFGNLVKYITRNEDGEILYYHEYTYAKVKK